MHLEKVDVDSDPRELSSHLILDELLLQQVRAVILVDLVEEAVRLVTNLTDVLFESILRGNGFADQILFEQVALRFLKSPQALFDLSLYGEHVLEAFQAFKVFEASLEVLHALVEIGDASCLRQTCCGSILQDAHVDGVRRPRSHLSDDTLTFMHAVCIRHEGLNVPSDVPGVREAGRLARVRLLLLRSLSWWPQLQNLLSLVLLRCDALPPIFDIVLEIRWHDHLAHYLGLLRKVLAASALGRRGIILDWLLLFLGLFGSLRRLGSLGPRTWLLKRNHSNT